MKSRFPLLLASVALLFSATAGAQLKPPRDAQPLGKPGAAATQAQRDMT